MYLENSITPRQLRTILFNVKYQEMTVRELRRILYDLSAQDETIPFGLVEDMRIAMKIKENG
jgi:hypothetical protein